MRCRQRWPSVQDKTARAQDELPVKAQLREPLYLMAAY
jgi:hypothetical protein